MIVRRTFAPKTVVIVQAVATVKGSKPLVGDSEEVEKKWRRLLEKLGMKAKDRYQHRILDRSATASELNTMNRMQFRRASDLGQTLAKFRNMDSAAKAAAAEDVFSPNWKPPKFDKNDPSYGRPKEGSLTEKRGIAAGHDIGKEIIELCDLICEYGEMQEDGTAWITFGELFDIYRFISDKVVGMLLRARKHNLVQFQGEMLYQRRDEDVQIRLLKSLSEVKRIYSQSDDPANCLSSF